MLRATLIAASWAAILIGAVLVIAGVRGPGIVLLIDGALVFLAIVFERWRYRRGETLPSRHAPQAPDGPPPTGESAQGADGPWERTGERFEDPETHATVEVLFNPRSGERRYVRI